MLQHQQRQQLSEADRLVYQGQFGQRERQQADELPYDEQDNKISEELIINIEDIQKQFICAICKDIVNDPVVCEKCDTFMCKYCVDTSKNYGNYKCPQKCSGQNTGVRKPTLTLMSLLNDLNLQCKDCNNMVKYEFFQRHLEKDCLEYIFKKMTLINNKSVNTDDDENGNNSTEEDEQQPQQNSKVCKNPKTNCNQYKLKTWTVNPYHQYQNKWFCDICRKVYKDGNPLHCNKCNDYDICQKCQTIPENVKCGGKNNQCSKKLKYTKQPYKNHEKYLGQWFCDKCKIYFINVPNIQCLDCEFDLCLSCANI